MLEILDSFQKKICITCKAEKCDKGIVLIRYEKEGELIVCAKCSDYIVNKDKLIGYKKPLEIEAKRSKPLIKGLG